MQTPDATLSRAEACAGHGRPPQKGEAGASVSKLFCSCPRMKGSAYHPARVTYALLSLTGGRCSAFHGAHHGPAWAAGLESSLLSETAGLWQWGVSARRAAL